MNRCTRLVTCLGVGVALLTAGHATAQTSGGLTSEPTPQEVREAIRLCESRDAQEIAKGLSLLKLASFGPKSAPAAGDVMRFLLTAERIDPTAVSTIAEKVAAAGKAAQPSALNELRRAKKLDPDRRQRIATGWATGSIEASAQLLGDAQWNDSITIGLDSALSSRELTVAERTALKPKVPVLVRAAQAAKPATGKATPEQISLGRMSLQIFARLGADGAAGMAVVSKIAADPNHPLQSEAANAIGKRSMDIEPIEQLLGMLDKDNASRQAATNELIKRDFQTILEPLTRALSDPNRSAVTVEAFATVIGAREDVVLTAQNAGKALPALQISPMAIEAARAASSTLAQIVQGLNSGSDPNIGVSVARVAGLYARDVAEMRAILVSLIRRDPKSASSGNAIEQLGTAGDVGIAELERLTSDQAEIASVVSVALARFPVADPLGLANKLLASTDSEEVRRGVMRLSASPERAMDAWVLLLPLRYPEFATVAADELRKLSTKTGYADRIVPLLVKLLSDPKDQTALLAARALAGENVVAIKPLVDLQKRMGHASPEPAEALVRIGTVGAVTLFDLAARVGARDVQPYLSSALLQIDPAIIKANLELVERAAGSEEPNVAAAAVKLLAGARPESFAALQRLAKSGRDATKIALPQYLSVDDEMERSLLKSLTIDPERTVAEAASGKLASADPGRAILLDMARSQDSRKRVLGATYLLGVGRPTDAEMNVIATLAKDPDVEVRRAIYVQAQGYSQLAERIAVSGLNESDQPCRRSALQAAAQMRKLVAADPLIQLLRIRDLDADNMVRDAAMYAIGNLTRGALENRVSVDPAVYEQLFAATKAPESMRRRYAIELLGDMAKAFDQPRFDAIRDAAKRLSQDEDPATREAATAVVQRLAQPSQ